MRERHDQVMLSFPVVQTISHSKWFQFIHKSTTFLTAFDATVKSKWNGVRVSIHCVVRSSQMKHQYFASNFILQNRAHIHPVYQHFIVNAQAQSPTQRISRHRAQQNQYSSLELLTHTCTCQRMELFAIFLQFVLHTISWIKHKTRATLIYRNAVSFIFIWIASYWTRQIEN